ncbi:CopG family ribbon-helix-helix protein [archaeon]|nr:CopG family ribbon-helix-helix protein [archaeon]
MPVTRFGVSLPQDLLKEVDAAVRELGLRTRSKLIERALRVFLTEQRWQRGRGHVAGVILLIYDHHTVEALTKLQHDYLSLIRSTTHVHLTPNLCLEAVVVEGSVQRVRRLVNALRGLSGIIELRTALVSIPSTKPRS